MQNLDRIIGLTVLALILIVLIYYLWPYLIGFLAAVGAAQIYHLYKHHNRKP
jgi:hypothetical protein